MSAKEQISDEIISYLLEVADHIQDIGEHTGIDPLEMAHMIATRIILARNAEMEKTDDN